MKKPSVLFGMFFFGTVLTTVSAARALPVCQPYTVQATYISRWQPHNQAWQAEFTCENRVQAKLHAEDVDDPAQSYGTFFIVDMNDVLESQESFPDPCEAVVAYCSGRLEPLDPEIKAMLVESMNELKNQDAAPIPEVAEPADAESAAEEPDAAEPAAPLSSEEQVRE